MIVATNTLNQLQKQLDIISNNIANTDTNGYKSRDVVFTDLLAQQFENQTNKTEEVGRKTPVGVRIGVGAKIAQSQMVLTQGNLKETGRTLDTAFTNANQFLKVLVNTNGESNVRYSRDGNLSLSPVGQNEVMLVNNQGYPILDENNQVITFSGNANKFAITNDGQFNIETSEGRQLSFNLGVISIKKPQYFEQLGDNLIGIPDNLGVNPTDVYTEMVGANRSDIAMKQGSLEASNVNLSKEMSDLINVQRSYQFQSRAITLSDQMMGLVNGIR